MVETDKIYATECMKFDVCNALDILWQGHCIPSSYFESCHGVLLLSTRETSVILVSGTVGSGLLISHDPNTGVWSPPLSVHLQGMGVGLSAGTEEKDLIVFLQSPELISKFASNCRLQLGGHVENHQHWGPQNSKAHHSKMTVFCFSRGAHCGVSFEGAVVSWNKKQHIGFYGTAISPYDVLHGVTKIRCNARSGVKDLHDELIILATGGAETPEKEANMETEGTLDAWRRKLEVHGLATV